MTSRQSGGRGKRDTRDNVSSNDVKTNKQNINVKTTSNESGRFRPASTSSTTRNFGDRSPSQNTSSRRDRPPLNTHVRSDRDSRGFPRTKHLMLQDGEDNLPERNGERLARARSNSRGGRVDVYSRKTEGYSYNSRVTHNGDGSSREDINPGLSSREYFPSEFKRNGGEGCTCCSL